MVRSKVEGKVTDLEIAMSKVEEHMKVTNEMLKALNEKMEGLDHIIRGNGSPGIVARVSILEDNKVSTDQTASKRWQMWTAIVALVLGNFAQWMVRHWRP